MRKLFCGQDLFFPKGTNTIFVSIFNLQLANRYIKLPISLEKGSFNSVSTQCCFYNCGINSGFLFQTRLCFRLLEINS